MKKFFVTTPIYYINDVPHIGHASTTVAADVIARLHRKLGEEVFFLTGTDEHGQKVAESAAKEGLEPQDYCDKIAPRFEEAWKAMNISHDFFIRTTDPRHKQVVNQILQKIYDNGDVYRGKYEGYYCIGCEKFLTETDMVDKHCLLHPPEKTVWKSEDHWFFKLSKYVPVIIKLIEDSGTNYIFPEGKRSEVLAKLKAGVKDVSISRENVKWGIPTPWDPSQTVYVWFDALLNYYSACQFVEGKNEYWPASLHLLGKEILWFHTVIWQAMLLSAELPLPVKTYTHSFYIIDGQKMSKSLGNVISPQQLIDLFGVDGSRYLIARSIPTENDSDIGIERFKERYNADLANNLGNLVSRVAKLSSETRFMIHDSRINQNYIDHVNNLRFDEAIGWVFANYVDNTNVRLNEVAPWKLATDDPNRLEVLKLAGENLLVAAEYLEPVMPETAKKIKETLTNGKGLEKPLFPRIK